jgi:hypothetical protein
MKDRFHEELECVFDKFPKYHMNMLLGDLNAKLCKENILKPTIGNDRFHEISNDNGVRIVNFATSKNPIVKSTVFLIVKFINILVLGHLLMEIFTIKMTIF